MQHLYVNYGLNSQTYDNIIIYKGTGKSSLGYFRAFSNSNVRIYSTDMSRVWNWYAGTHFSFPWTVNQSVSLTGTKSGDIGTDEKSNSVQFSDTPALTVSQAQLYIYKADPGAVDLYSK